jgi:hypothetical protein
LAGHRRPGLKGPSKELIDAIVEFKRRNPRVGCPRIAQEIARAALADRTAPRLTADGTGSCTAHPFQVDRGLLRV